MFAAALDRAEVVRCCWQHGADAHADVEGRRSLGVVAPEEKLQEAIRDAQNAKSAATAARRSPAAAPAALRPRADVAASPA